MNLRKQKKSCSKLLLWNGLSKKNLKSYVLTNTAKIMEPRSFQYYIQSFSKEFKKNYSAGDFRDIFIVNSLQREMSLMDLSEILGLSVCHLYQEYQKFIKVSDKVRERELKKIKY